jgi:osmoprotectant transport system ATP-binding protein
MGYVIQSGDLFPHLTARQNILLVAQELRLGIDEITTRMEQLCVLTRFRSDLLDRYPVELSGGEQRRASLARALMLKPDILLLDEPLGALDPIVRAGLLTDLTLFERTTTAVIVVTHNLGKLQLGDWVVLLDSGRIVQQGPFANFPCVQPNLLRAGLPRSNGRGAGVRTQLIALLIGTLLVARVNRRSAIVLGSKNSPSPSF